MGEEIPDSPRVEVYPSRREMGAAAGRHVAAELRARLGQSDDGRLRMVFAAAPSQQEMLDRMMFVQANEAAKCFEENVVMTVADTNIGSIFGWGFAPFQGGALQFINAVGVAEFVKRSEALAAKFGARFAPAAVLKKMAAEGRHFE